MKKPYPMTILRKEIQQYQEKGLDLEELMDTCKMLSKEYYKNMPETKQTKYNEVKYIIENMKLIYKR